MREIEITEIDISKTYKSRWKLGFVCREEDLLLAKEGEDLILKMSKYGKVIGFFLIEEFSWRHAEKHSRETKVKGSSDKVRIFEDKDEILKEKI